MARRRLTAEEIRIGTSGWNYGHWRGCFYPADLPRRDWLAHYQKEFSTVELNASFYRRIRRSTWERWRQQSPEGFVWAVKAHRQITRFTRLRQRKPLREFLQSVAALGNRLGVILFQLPPSLKFDATVAKRFFGWLPEDKRYAIEPRHPSWFSKKPLALLRQHGVALCMADCGTRYPSAQKVTADFVYVRFHGREQLYRSRYTLAQLRPWARKLVQWKKPAFVYFNNDFGGYAVENARMLRREIRRLLESNGQHGRKMRQRSKGHQGKSRRLK
jgi:uncharacterized protein YecE (DUF72 family)